MISDPNPGEERHLGDDLPLCPSCRLRPANLHTPLHLCQLCSDEGRRYGWD